MKNSLTKRFRIFWVISGFLAIYITASGLNIGIPTIELLRPWQELWRSAKQSLEIRLHRDARKLSERIQILKLPYSNRVDFWFDDATKKLLIEKLRNYSGPIILNFEPQRLLADPEMKAVFENPHLIRPMRIDTNVNTNLKYEKEISHQFFQFESEDFAFAVGSPRILAPQSIDYYKSSESSRSFGSLDLFKEPRSNRFEYYPLYSKASIYPVPTVGLSALAPLDFCKDLPKLSSDFHQIECGERQWPSLLPIFFYSIPDVYNPDPTEAIQEIENSSKILIVEVIDSSSPLFNIRGEKISFGTYVATAISNILQNDFFTRPPFLKWFEFIFGLIAMVLIFMASKKCRLPTLLGFISSIFLLLIVSDIVLSIQLHLHTRPIEVAAAILLISITAILMRILLELEDRLLLERAFAGYVSPSRLKRLLSGHEKLQLDGRLATITTMIIDIAGFSKISERLQPSEVFELLKHFFSVIDPIIFEFSGVIDKKTGDGLLAFFGDADESRSTELNLQAEKNSAIAAVNAALKIQTTLQNIDWSKDFKGRVRSLPIRVGINTGYVFIGNAGSERHFNYTVLGESVNFTQRLEAACPLGSVLVGQETFNLVRDLFECRELQISVKNQDDLSTAFEIIKRP